MPGLEAKALDQPDQVRPFKDGIGSVKVVSLSNGDVGYGSLEPGRRRSEHVEPIAGSESCQVEHVGYVLKAHMKVVMDDGSEIEVAPGDAFRMPPGHDAWIVGDERCEMVDFGGLKGYAQAQ